MKKVLREMVKDYQLKKLKYDFMGYFFNNTNELSFHHLIIARKDCDNVLAKGYVRWNGAVLKQTTSHEYLHLIETIDRDIFDYITQQMIEENINGKIDAEHLIKIRDALLRFEVENSDRVNHNGQLMIKRPYILERIPIKH